MTALHLVSIAVLAALLYALAWLSYRQGYEDGYEAAESARILGERLRDIGPIYTHDGATYDTLENRPASRRER